MAGNNTLQLQKIKRILIYYQELERMHISHEGSMNLMIYVFNVSERWLVEILRDNSLDELQHVTLEHIDLDMMMIDRFAEKTRKQAIKARKEQLKLF